MLKPDLNPQHREVFNLAASSVNTEFVTGVEGPVTCLAAVEETLA